MSTLILDNAVIWTGDGTAFPGHLVARDGVIQTVAPGCYGGAETALDMDGLALSPGLIDLMLLGGFGYSPLHGDAPEIARRSAAIGVTSIQFCGGMLGEAANLHYADNIRAAMRAHEPGAARVLGWYPEGPFLNPNLTGAMPEHAAPPTLANVHRFLDAAGDTFAMINISPGLEGDVAAIAGCRAAGKTVSMAHSNASAARTAACLAAGTSVLGHFNCNNRGLVDSDGRQVPTIEQMALTDDRVRFIHLICDGVHTDDVYVRLALRARGIEHLCVVTDAQPLAGCDDGPFTADDGRTFVKAGPVARTTDGILVGSTWLLPDQLRHFVRITGLPHHQAIRAVTLNPAASLGLDSEIGLLAPGRVADIVAWDAELRVRHVWKSGLSVEPVSELMEVTV